MDQGRREAFDRYERWMAKAKPVMMVFLLLVGLAFIGLGGFSASYFSDGAGLGPWLFGAMALTGAGLAGLAFVLLMRSRPAKPFHVEALMPRLAEWNQRRRANQMLGFPVLLSVQLVALLSTDSSITRLAFAAMALVSATPLLTNLFGLNDVRALRAVMDDELTAAHRAKALKAGFAVLLAANAALACVAWALEPRGTTISVALCFYAGLATASVRFGLLERAALRQDAVLDG